MFLTVTSTARSPAEPATDLGYLLHKHPGTSQRFDVSVGQAHVFYPEATEERCTAALLVEVDPIALVRSGRSSGTRSADYVNDRPYAGSSLLAVALAAVFRTAMAGRCAARPDLVDRRLSLELRVPALPSRLTGGGGGGGGGGGSGGSGGSGGPDLARRLFGPLGWTVDATPVPLDPALPHWGDSAYLDVRLRGTTRLADALTALYVLLPVLDDAKHYWVFTDEVDKLLRAGAGWLADHPERDLITRRYLKHQRGLVAGASEQLARLAEVDDGPTTVDAAGSLTAAAEPEGDAAATGNGTGAASGRPLAAQRCEAVLGVLRSAGARRVADLGCGDGSLLRDLLADPAYDEIVGVDASAAALDAAARRLRLAELPERQRERVRLAQSALTYRDERLAGWDAAVLMEVVEHVDPPRLGALERAVFGAARPAMVVVTTPNAEHNVRYPGLMAHGQAAAFRHPDHRFEWTRVQFRAWAAGVGERHGYVVRHLPVGVDDPDVGPPTQLAVFTSTSGAAPPGGGQ